jgi:hypothetical protein
LTRPLCPPPITMASYFPDALEAIGSLRNEGVAIKEAPF